MDVVPSNLQSEMAEESEDVTQHSTQISPVFGDIVVKMKLAGEREIQRLLALGAPIVIDRGYGIEEWYTWPPTD
jgi:hypothetical protein